MKLFGSLLIRFQLFSVNVTVNEHAACKGSNKTQSSFGKAETSPKERPCYSSINNFAVVIIALWRLSCIGPTAEVLGFPKLFPRGVPSVSIYHITFIMFMVRAGSMPCNPSLWVSLSAEDRKNKNFPIGLSAHLRKSKQSNGRKISKHFPVYFLVIWEVKEDFRKLQNIFIQCSIIYFPWCYIGPVLLLCLLDAQAWK